MAASNQWCPQGVHVYLRLTWKCEVGAQLGLSGVFQGSSGENLCLSGVGWSFGMSPNGSQSLVQEDSTEGGGGIFVRQLS